MGEGVDTRKRERGREREARERGGVERSGSDRSYKLY